MAAYIGDDVCRFRGDVPSGRPLRVHHDARVGQRDAQPTIDAPKGTVEIEQPQMQAAWGDDLDGVHGSAPGWPQVKVSNRSAASFAPTRCLLLDKGGRWEGWGELTLGPKHSSAVLDGAPSADRSEQLQLHQELDRPIGAVLTRVASQRLE